MNRFLCLAVCASLLFLSGCSVFSPIDHHQKQYVLGQMPPVPTTAKKHLSLLIPRPATAVIYDTTQMAYVPRQWEISYFAKNRWGEKPADMIQGLLVKTFEATKAFTTVSKIPMVRCRMPGSVDISFHGRKSDFIDREMKCQQTLILHPELLHFEEDLTGPQPVFRVDLRADLQDMHGILLASGQFSATRPLTTQSPYAMVIAANQALADVLHQASLFFMTKIHTKGS